MTDKLSIAMDYVNLLENETEAIGDRIERLARSAIMCHRKALVAEVLELNRFKDNLAGKAAAPMAEPNEVKDAQ